MIQATSSHNTGAKEIIFPSNSQSSQNTLLFGRHVEVAFLPRETIGFTNATVKRRLNVENVDTHRRLFLSVNGNNVDRGSLTTLRQFLKEIMKIDNRESLTSIEGTDLAKLNAFLIQIPGFRKILADPKNTKFLSEVFDSNDLSVICDKILSLTKDQDSLEVFLANQNALFEYPSVVCDEERIVDLKIIENFCDLVHQIKRFPNFLQLFKDPKNNLFFKGLLQSTDKFYILKNLFDDENLLKCLLANEDVFIPLLFYTHKEGSIKVLRFLCESHGLMELFRTSKYRPLLNNIIRSHLAPKILDILIKDSSALVEQCDRLLRCSWGEEIMEILNEE